MNYRSILPTSSAGPNWWKDSAALPLAAARGTGEDRDPRRELWRCRSHRFLRRKIRSAEIHQRAPELLVLGAERLHGGVGDFAALAAIRRPRQHCTTVVEGPTLNDPWSMEEEQYTIWLCRGMKPGLQEFWGDLKNWN